MEVPVDLIPVVTERIENLPTPNGQVTINGLFYEYVNCDLIVADLREPEGRPIPTLSEWGLIAMAGLLGLFGFSFMTRRKAGV